VSRRGAINLTGEGKGGAGGGEEVGIGPNLEGWPRRVVDPRRTSLGNERGGEIHGTAPDTGGRVTVGPAVA
jgi:hypothetical protein